MNHDEEIESRVREMVQTDQFVSRYPSRLKSAIKGNPKPLVRMMTTFARELAEDGFDVAEVVTLLLHEAKATLEPTGTESMWNTVHDMVQSGFKDTGSEVAA